MKEIKKILKPLRFRLNLEKWLRFFFLCETAGLVCVLLLVLVSKFRYIPSLTFYISGIVIFAFFLSLYLLYQNRETLKETAKVYDSLGLKERLTTAIELTEEGSGSNISQMVISDAVEKGRQAHLEKEYKIKLPKKTIKVLLLVLVALCTAGFIENPQIFDVKGSLSQQISEIDQIKKDLNQQGIVVEEDLLALNKEISAITKEIKTASSKKDGLKALDSAQQKLKELEKNSVSKDLDALSNALGENSNTKGLGEAIAQGDLSAMAEELEKLNEMLSAMSDEELQKLLDTLLEKAEELGNEGLKEALENYAQNVGEGNLNSGTNGLGELGTSLNTAVTSAQSTKQAVGQLNQTLKNAADQLNGTAENPEGSQGENSGSQGDGTQGGEQPQSGGDSAGNGAGSGAAEGQGQGNGEGQGQGWGTGHVETEKVFSRELSGKSGYDTQIEGTENAGGEISSQTQRTTGSQGESVPYDQVVGEYRQQALQGLEESTIPYGMKELVADYFSQLEK